MEQTEDSSCIAENDESKSLIKRRKQKKSQDHDDYFTRGKYLTYFFLGMERQYYDYDGVGRIVWNLGFDKPCGEAKKLHGQISCNLPDLIRREFLPRRSFDNLIANSSFIFQQYSGYDLLDPINAKLRTMSHDSLAKDNRTSSRVGDGSNHNHGKEAVFTAKHHGVLSTHKARERNFLHGRVAANSLLGTAELEKVLPNREIKIFIGTWNMNGQSPPKELNDFMLPTDLDTVPDVLVIGTQESCSERHEWEVLLQETIGPSHVMLTSAGLGTLHLALFLRRELIWYCSVPEEDSYSTRTGTAFKTKGAVALGLIIFGTSFLFLTTHLTANQDKVKERLHDIKRITRNINLPKELPTRNKTKDVTLNFDCVFWCGDLNFRIDQPREDVIEWIKSKQFPRETPVNLKNDQLRIILDEQRDLHGFKEAPITFSPTYKYDPGTQNFDTSSKQRIPAYTDRILFKGKEPAKDYLRQLRQELASDAVIKCLVYDSVPSMCTSDHKPVWGVFNVVVRPGIDTIPLAAGMFNRDVYLEGIRRRTTMKNKSNESSKACSIQ